MSGKKANKKITLKKPSQVTMISNGEISATQRKAYNVLLYKASQELKKDNTKNVFLIAISEIKNTAGIKATDNWHLKKDLRSLMNVQVEIIHEKKDNWDIFVLLSHIKKENNFLKFEIPSIIREALIREDYFTTLDLMILKSLRGKYAVILYEFAIRYNKVEMPKLSIDEFKLLTGTQNYRDFSDVRKKVIEPGIKEINEKTDIEMSYEPFKAGRKVVAIKFSLKRKEQDEIINITPFSIQSEPVEKRATNQPAPDKATTKNPTPDQTNIDILIALLPEKHREKKTIQKTISNALKKYDADYIRRNIKYANKNANGNYRAYLAKALAADWGLGLYEDQQEAAKVQDVVKAAQAAAEAEQKAESEARQAYWSSLSIKTQADWLEKAQRKFKSKDQKFLMGFAVSMVWAARK